MSSGAGQMRTVFPLPGNEAFAAALAEAGGFESGVVEPGAFPTVRAMCAC